MSGGASVPDRALAVPAKPCGLGASRLETIMRAEVIARVVADRCHGDRKPGQASDRYAIIWQAARLGAIEAMAVDERTVRLVLAARSIAFGDFSLIENRASFDAAMSELDTASEAFAAVVAWVDEPDAAIAIEARSDATGAGAAEGKSAVIAQGDGA